MLNKVSSIFLFQYLAHPINTTVIFNKNDAKLSLQYCASVASTLSVLQWTLVLSKAPSHWEARCCLNPVWRRRKAEKYQLRAKWWAPMAPKCTQKQRVRCITCLMTKTLCCKTLPSVTSLFYRHSLVPIHAALFLSISVCHLLEKSWLKSASVPSTHLPTEAMKPVCHRIHPSLLTTKFTVLSTFDLSTYNIINKPLVRTKTLFIRGSFII